MREPMVVNPLPKRRSLWQQTAFDLFLKTIYNTHAHRDVVPNGTPTPLPVRGKKTDGVTLPFRLEREIMTDSPTILVVDDDQELREGLRLVLHKHGYRTLEADDGAEARKLIDRHRPDLVILDMMMPRWGGLAVLEHFHGKTDAPPFIMLSGNDTRRLQGYAEELGVVAYIAKPFSMVRLLEGVAKVVGEPESAAPQKTIICRCPRCRARIKAPVRIIGKTRLCPGCQAPFVVAVRPPEDEGPKLVLEEGW